MRPPTRSAAGMMPKKLPKLNKNKEVKAIARERIGTPPPVRLLDEKPVRTKPKHKKPIAPDYSE
jgi:hypothetical protein